jgi:hypothetical protein
MNVLDTIIDLQFLKDKDACKEGIVYFEKNIKEPIAARELIEKLLATKKREKMEWVSWLLCQLFNLPHYIQYAVFASEQVLPIFEAKYPSDKRPREAIEAAKKVALNDTEENRKIAARAAYVANEAANAANEAANAANAAAYAANAAAYAANAVAYAADYAADYAAAYVAYAAEAAANAVAYTAGGKEMLLKIISFGIGLLENK